MAVCVDHVIDYYQDGFAAIPFCKNCSAEGEALHDICKPLLTCQEINVIRFEEKYQSALDQSKLKR
jgi:hypothetical protein